MNHSSLSPVIGPVSLEKLAYDAIKTAILNFQLKPGVTVVESELARQLGISKTPVRDALGRLEKEGFIEKTPYKGYTVAPVSKEGVMEIFEIRAVLEGLAARQATPNFDEEDFQLGEDLLKQHQSAVQNKSPQQASSLNQRFHRLIQERSQNRWLRQILTNLDDHLQRYRVLSTYQSGRLEKSLEEHRQILQAIRNQQPDEAEQITRTHLLSVLEDLESQDFEELINQVRQDGGPLQSQSPE